MCTTDRISDMENQLDFIAKKNKTNTMSGKLLILLFVERL